MKTFKLFLIIYLLIICSTAFATGGKKMPPIEPTWIEKIVEIFTVKQK